MTLDDAEFIDVFNVEDAEKYQGFYLDDDAECSGVMDGLEQGIEQAWSFFSQAA